MTAGRPGLPLEPLRGRAFAFALVVLLMLLGGMVAFVAFMVWSLSGS